MGASFSFFGERERARLLSRLSPPRAGLRLRLLPRAGLRLRRRGGERRRSGDLRLLSRLSGERERRRRSYFRTGERERLRRGGERERERLRRGDRERDRSFLRGGGRHLPSVGAGREKRTREN